MDDSLNGKDLNLCLILNLNFTLNTHLSFINETDFLLIFLFLLKL